MAAGTPERRRTGFRRWWRSLKAGGQVAALGVAATLIVGVFGALPTYLVLAADKPGPQTSTTPQGTPTTPPASPQTTAPATEPPVSRSPTPSPTASPSATPTPTLAKPSTPAPPPPVAFSFTSAGTVPNCSDVHGTGDSPPRGRTAVLFVRVPGHTRYYYEQPLRFDAARQTWRANRVVVGDQTSAGQRFELHAYAVSDS